jgi:hypothetical protein
MESSGLAREREVLFSSPLAVVAGQIKNAFKDLKIGCCCRHYSSSSRCDCSFVSGDAVAHLILFAHSFFRSFKIFSSFIFSPHLPLSQYLGYVPCTTTCIENNVIYRISVPCSPRCHDIPNHNVPAHEDCCVEPRGGANCHRYAVPKDFGYRHKLTR